MGYPRAWPTSLGLLLLALAPGTRAQPVARAKVDALVGNGFVRDALGEPVAAADVRLLDGDGNVLRRTATDGSGAFVLGGIPRLRDSRVEVLDAGHAKLVLDLDGTVESVRVLAWLVLRDGDAVAGTVRDAAGRPLEGVEIAGGHSTCTSDAGGHYVLRHVPLGACRLVARAAEHVDAAATVLVASGARHDFVLARDERPTWDVHVRVMAPDDLAYRLDVGLTPHDTFRTHRGAGGSAIDLRRLRGERIFLRVRDESSGFVLAQREVGMDAKAPATVAIDVTERETYEAAGSVVDAASRGIAGLRLEIRDASTHARIATTTDTDGAFRVRLPSHARPSLSVAPASEEWVFDLASVQPVDPRAGPLALRADRACSVRGRVVAPDGAPVPHAHLCLAAPHNRILGHSTRGRDQLANARGEFTFTGLHPSDVDLLLIARSDRLAAIRTDVALPKPGTVLDVVVRTAQAAEVRGIVVDAAGSPVANACVRLPRELVATIKGTRPRAVPFTEAFTARDGRFRILGLPEGRYHLYVNPSSRSVGPGERIELAAGEVEDLGTLRTR